MSMPWFFPPNHSLFMFKQYVRLNNNDQSLTSDAEKGLKLHSSLFFTLHRAISVSSDVGYTRGKGNSLHRLIPVSSVAGYTRGSETGPAGRSCTFSPDLFPPVSAGLPRSAPYYRKMQDRPPTLSCHLCLAAGSQQKIPVPLQEYPEKFLYSCGHKK